MFIAQTLEDGIAPEVLSHFPGYCWGKVVALGLDNRQPPPAVTDQLRDTEAWLRAHWGHGEVVAHPAIAAWRAHSWPTRCRSSLEGSPPGTSSTGRSRAVAPICTF
jgi:hypothetical protein